MSETMLEREQTCAERIDAQLESRLVNMADMLERAQNQDSDMSELAYEEIMQFPLCIDKRVEYKIQLSTGGPGDEFLVTLDEDGAPVEIRYRFLDWWDGATVSLQGTQFDAAWDALASYCEVY